MGEQPTGPECAAKALRVAIVSKADRTGGGGSLVAEQLCRLLREHGHQADHWMAWHGARRPPHARPLHGTWHARWIGHAHNACRHLGLPDFLPLEYAVLRRHLSRYDVVHFHDISSAVSPLTLRWVARRRPTAWTLHDCSPFTGGCLYPMDCTAFHTRCGRCPRLDQWPLGGRLGFDFTNLLHDMKRTTAGEGRFATIAPSRWMAEEAMRSGMFADRPRVIPNPVDMRVFRPFEKRAVRAALGMRPDVFWILVSAGALADRRKGAQAAIEVIRRCQRQVAVLLVGREDSAVTARFAGTTVRATGFLDDPQTIAQYYAAADVLLFPTLADNLPCTILESMAAGTPTLGFRTGGVPEMVEHDGNGWLAASGDVAGLVTGLQRACDDRYTLRRWAAAGVRMAREGYAPAHFVDRHVQLYRRQIAVHEVACLSGARGRAHSPRLDLGCEAAAQARRAEGDERQPDGNIDRHAA
ncbi:MAG: glycosyltransferase [Planctomycetota bacterium]